MQFTVNVWFVLRMLLVVVVVVFLFSLCSFVHSLFCSSILFLLFVLHCKSVRSLFYFLFFHLKRSIECSTVQTCATPSTSLTTISPSKSLAKTVSSENDLNENCQWLCGTNENEATTSVLIAENRTGTNSTAAQTTKTTTVTLTIAASLQQTPTPRQISSFFTSKSMFATHTLNKRNLVLRYTHKHTCHWLRSLAVHSSVTSSF